MKEVRDIVSETYSELHAQDKEFGEVIPKARKFVDPKGVIVARREHIPFYIGVPRVNLPNVKSLEDFRVWVEKLPEERPIYIYFGSDEKKFRPQLGQLSSAQKPPDWIEPLAQSQVPNMWVLYSVKRGH